MCSNIVQSKIYCITSIVLLAPKHHLLCENWGHSHFSQNLGALKFNDSADFKPALIMRKLKDNVLPEKVLRLFKVRDGQNHL